MQLSETDQRALGQIGFDWGDAYNLAGDGEVYTATRIGAPGHVLTAETAQGLREAIRADYFAWTATLRGERMST